MMFSKTSIAKLSELNDAKAWILWLKSEIERAEANNMLRAVTANPASFWRCGPKPMSKSLGQKLLRPLSVSSSCVGAAT
jgi:hypothetical protein